MIKICNDKTVCPKWDGAYQGKTFRISPNLFLEARDYAYANGEADGACFPVVDQKGKLLFWMQYQENLVLGIKRNDFPDYEKCFSGKERLDFSFLNQYRTFVFTEAEEYSVAIARLLQKFCPDKRCVFLDKRAKYFIKGKSVRFLPFCGAAGRYMELLKNWMQGKNQNIGLGNRFVCLFLYRIIKALDKKRHICIAATDRECFWPVDSICNSAKLLYSVLWCKITKSFGDKNEDKTIVLLDYPCFNEGLVSIIRWTYTHVRWILEKGYTPVVDLHAYPNQYLNSEKENMWEYFFEPVSEISTAEVYESRHVISASDNTILLGESKINPYQEKWGRRSLDSEAFCKLIRLNKETKRYMEGRMPRELPGKVLGVVMRGTDFRKEAAEKINKEWRKDIVDAETFLQACIHFKNELEYEYIFLATEDAEYFEMFRKTLGDRLLSVDQKRVSYDYKNREYIQVKDLLEIQDGKAAGRNYLAVIHCLSLCDSLLYNIECGAAQLAECWNNNKYRVCRQITAGWKE